jgi:AcrR family transcriptional regulator
MAQERHDPIQEIVAAARRAQILDAATRVFAEKGLHRATIKDVARAAGVADGTIYNYFDNKDALLIGILERVNESQRRAADIAAADDTDPETFIRSYTAHRLAHLSTNNLDVLRVIVSELLVNPTLAQTYVAKVVAPTFTIGEQPFIAWQEAGVVRTSDPQLATRAMAGMVLGLLVLRMLGDPYLNERWDAVGGVVADLLLHGLGIGEPTRAEPYEPGESAAYTRD